MPRAPLRADGVEALRSQAPHAGPSRAAYAPQASIVAVARDSTDENVDQALQQAVKAMREQVGAKQVHVQLAAHVAPWLAEADLSHAQDSKTLARLTSLWMGRLSPAVARMLLEMLVPPLSVPGVHVDGCLAVLAHVARVRIHD